MDKINPRNKYTVKVGKMQVEEGRVKPLNAKGELVFFINEESK